MSEPFRPAGVYPMLFTPFDSAGRLDRAGLALEIEAMMAHDVDGVAVLGLASEGDKLATEERRQLMEWTAALLAGRKPFCVTVLEPSLQGQIDAVRAAAALGARWVILQPPKLSEGSEAALLGFLGQVADKSEVPVAIQVAPDYLGVGISDAGLASLNRNHPNVSLVKLETGAGGVARLREATAGALSIFTGRAGIAMIDAIRAGAAGVIPGAESADLLSRIFGMMTGRHPGGEAGAMELYRKVLPMLVFLMESIDSFLVYGKLIIGRRLAGFPAAVRPPFTPANPVCEAFAREYAESFGPLRAATAGMSPAI